MTEKPISDLRRRMLEDMAVRRLGEKTQHDYINTSRRSPASSAARLTRRDGGGSACLPGAPAAAGGQAAEDEHAGFGAALLPQDHARSPRSRPCAGPRGLSKEVAARAADGRRGTTTRGRPRTGPAIQGGAEHCLRRGLAQRGGGDAARRRHRQQAHADPGRAGQGQEGSLRPAVAATGADPTRLVAAVPLAGLVVSGEGPAAADLDAPAQSRLPSWRPTRQGSERGSRRARCAIPSQRI